jgi:hypothetical protein
MDEARQWLFTLEAAPPGSGAPRRQVPHQQDARAGYVPGGGDEPGVGRTRTGQTGQGDGRHPARSGRADRRVAPAAGRSSVDTQLGVRSRVELVRKLSDTN